MRPELDLKTDPEEFVEYYWLKEELYTFCSEHGLNRTGSKNELAAGIYEFLKTGKIIIPQKNKTGKPFKKNIPITLASKIPAGYRNDERHRAFFKSVIGEHFKFNVPFMNWMKENAGKSYKEAVSVWKTIITEKKKGKKTEISSQFEYNQYTRDFFNAHPNANRNDAVTCWKYKKSLPGHNKYEKEDLGALRK